MQADDGRVVSNFIVQALKGEPLTVYGDGRQTRSFCYIDDLIDGLVQLMGAPAELAGPINLGNPDEVTVLELATRISRLVGGDVGIVFQALPTDDPRRRRPDITRAREQLGWRPVIPLGKGLRKTIAEFRTRLGDPQTEPLTKEWEPEATFSRAVA